MVEPRLSDAVGDLLAMMLRPRYWAVLLDAVRYRQQALRRNMAVPPVELSDLERGILAVAHRAAQSRTEAPPLAPPPSDTDDGPALLLTVEQASQVLALSTRKVEQMVAKGQIASVKIGRARRIHRDELDRIAKEGL